MLRCYQTADFGPKKDHTPRVVHTAGPKVGEPVDVTEDQEFVILEIRIELLEKAFEGMTVMPSRWHSATNPTVVEKAREHRYLQRHVYQHKVQPPGYQEQYGVQSILRRLRHECPFWNLTAQHVIKVLKKHRILHSDDVCYTERPVLDSAPDVWPPGPHVWHPSVLEDEAWTSKVAFYSAVSSVLQGRKYEGYVLRPDPVRVSHAFLLARCSCVVVSIESELVGFQVQFVAVEGGGQESPSQGKRTRSPRLIFRAKQVVTRGFDATRPCALCVRRSRMWTGKTTSRSAFIYAGSSFP